MRFGIFSGRSKSITCKYRRLLMNYHDIYVGVGSSIGGRVSSDNGKGNTEWDILMTGTVYMLLIHIDGFKIVFAIQLGL